MVRVLNQALPFGSFFFSSVWKRLEMSGKAVFLSSFCPVNPGLHGSEKRGLVSNRRLRCDFFEGVVMSRPKGDSQPWAARRVRESAATEAMKPAAPGGRFHTRIPRSRKVPRLEGAPRESTRPIRRAWQRAAASPARHGTPKTNFQTGAAWRDRPGSADSIGRWCPAGCRPRTLQECTRKAWRFQEARACRWQRMFRPPPPTRRPRPSLGR